MYIIPCISSCVYMKINYCLRCEHQWPSKLERVLTCAKCRSPYWDVPKGQRDIEPVAEKKSVEAPPIVEKKTELDSLRSIMEAVQVKRKVPHPDLPVYPVEDQPAYDDSKYLQYD